MRRALELASRGMGRVEPNPMVGCVIVRNGRILAEGWHRRFGGPHAEIVALQQASRRGVQVRGADVYVTLEPCCHHGKTPPCTDALIAARPARVIAAMVDPFPRVAGGGLAALRRAGIKVRVGVGRDEAVSLNAPFIHRVTTGLPWVIAKWAQMLDGRMALPANRPGKPAWISNEKSRRDAHLLRAQVDAIVVGVGTIIADDPRLTARGVPVRRVGRRVVVDPDLRTPERAAVLDVKTVPVTIAVRESVLCRRSVKLRRLEARGVEFVALPAMEGRRVLDLEPLFRHLADGHSATNVLVEGGAFLLEECFRQKLVCETHVYLAPFTLGRNGAARLPHAPGLNGTRLELVSLSRFDGDVCLRSRVC